MKKVLTALMFIAMLLINCSGITHAPAVADEEYISSADYRDAMLPSEVEDPSDVPTTFMNSDPCKRADKHEQKAIAEEMAATPKAKEDAPAAVKPTPKAEVEETVLIEETSVALQEPVSSRYAAIIPQISEAEIMLIAAAVYQESNNQCFDGQQAVAEVILNRMLNKAFPNTAYEVLYQTYNGRYQFSTAPLLASTAPNQTNIDAVMAALYGTPVLDSTNVVFFARYPENNSIAAVIGAHYFCRAYSWG